MTLKPFQNNFSAAIRVELIVEEDDLRARIYSEQPFKEVEIKTEIEEISADYKKVTLLNAANDSVINESVYKNFKE